MAGQHGPAQTEEEEVGSPEQEFFPPRESFSSFYSVDSDTARSERSGRSVSVEDVAVGQRSGMRRDFHRQSSLNSRILEEAKLEGKRGFRKVFSKFTSVPSPECASEVVSGKEEAANIGSESPAAPQAVSYWRLYRYADFLDCFLILFGILASVLHGAVVPANIFFFGRIINSFGAHQKDPSKAASEVAKIAFILFVVSLGSLVVSWIEVACWMQTGERQAARLRIKYLQALLRQEIAFFDMSMRTEDVVSSLSTDTLLVQEAIGEKVGKYLHNMGTCGAGIIVALLNCWQLALMTVVSLPLLLGTGLIYGGVYKKLVAQGHNSQTAASSIIQQALSQIRTVYADVGEARALASFSKMAKHSTRLGWVAGLVKGLRVGATLGIINFSWGLGLWYGSTLVARREIDGGKVLTTLFCVVVAGMSLEQSTPELQAFRRGMVAAHKIFELLDRVPEIMVDSATCQVLELVRGTIQFDNVSFHYPARPDAPIFSGLSFTINAGEHVALVGGSGSGKSTVIALLERFYDTTAGQVTIDGTDIRRLQLPWLRTRIGLISQEPALFSTTVVENIMYGNPHARREEVETAAKAAHAHDFIAKLPKAYHTRVGEKGVQLSGGQKQRIAVARAVIKHPAILLLDEATSELDAESQMAVQDSLDMLMLNRTTITVAHRLSTVKDADKILVLSNSRIAEVGTHRDLLLKGSDGIYSSLVLLQQAAQGGKDQGIERAASRSPAVWPARDAGTPSKSAMGILDSNEMLGPCSTSPYGTPASSLGTSTSSRRSPTCVTPQGLPNKSGESKSFEDRNQVMKPQDQATTNHGTSALWYVRKSTLSDALSVLAGSAGAVVSGTLNPLFAYLMIKAVTHYYSPNQKRQADISSLAITGLGIMAIASNVVQHFFFAVMGETLSQRMQEKTFEGIMRNEVGWFDREDCASSMITSRISSNALLLRKSVVDRFPAFIQCVAAIVVALSISFTLQWRMAIVCVATFPVVIVGGSIKQRFEKRGFAGDLRKSLEQVTIVAAEAVRNIRIVAAFGAEDKTVVMFHSRLTKHEKVMSKQAQSGGLLFGVSQCSMFAANALLLWYASVLVKQRHANFAAALQTFQILAWTGYFLAEAVSLVPQLVKGHKAASAMLIDINRESQIEPDRADGQQLKAVEGRVDLDRVTFWFPSRPEVTVLDNVTINIPAGITQALVGTRGSGKSTIIALIERFYDPTGGSVLIDGLDIRGLNLRSMRKHIGLVQQEPLLFSTTIRDNILYGTEQASEAEVIEAAKAANAYTFIRSLPKGFDTEVGENGVQLSGGQKQRVAIARAVLKNPAIMLLDEATSSLDSDSERLVQKALDNIMHGNRTTIVVAHRLNTVRNADKISVLLNGKVVEEGEHEFLVRTGGVYKKLLELQTLGV